MAHANTYLNAPSITVRTTCTQMDQLLIPSMEKAMLKHYFEGKTPDTVIEFTAKMVDGRIKGIDNIRVI